MFSTSLLHMWLTSCREKGQSMCMCVINFNSSVEMKIAYGDKVLKKKKPPDLTSILCAENKLVRSRKLPNL